MVASVGGSANLYQAGWQICPWRGRDPPAPAPSAKVEARASCWGSWQWRPIVREVARKPKLHLSSCRVSLGPNFISLLAGCELFQVVEILFCQRLELRGFSVFDSICCGARVRCRVEMEEENYLRMILSSSPPPLLGTPSYQGSPPVSSIPSDSPPPPTSHVQALVQDQHWSNEVVRFLLSQCKEHVEAHNTITMRQHQWVRIHRLLVAQFPHESGRKVKSLVDKWEKLRSTYSKMKKLRNQTSGGAHDDGAKFIWYDEIDEILSLIAKANGVPGGMDQGVSMLGTGSSSAPIDVSQEDDGDGEPAWTQSPTHTVPPSSASTTRDSTRNSPRTRTTNLVGCRGKGTSSQPSKRPKVEQNLMETLDRMADSTTKIEKLRIEAALTIHKDNLVERQENRKLELQMFRLQQKSSERLAAMFVNVVKKFAK